MIVHLLPIASALGTALVTALAAPSATTTTQGATRLEEIQIEGRLQLPEVLFISAHEPPDFDDRLYRAFADSAAARHTLAPEPTLVRSNLIPWIEEILLAPRSVTAPSEPRGDLSR
jgi:hypothetical protein